MFRGPAADRNGVRDAGTRSFDAAGCTVQPLIDGWMRSPGHRVNILNPEYTETGVGVARSPDGVLFYCQVFGRASLAL